MKKLLIASALLVSATTANAAIYEVTLSEHLVGRGDNPPSASIIVSQGAFLYDDVTGELSSTGLTQVRSQTNPTAFGRIFDRYITDLNIVGGSAAGTTAYDCVDGGFSFAVGASFCGNYLWGDNFVNDSSATYGPGLAFSRTILGDDVAAGDQQSINDYNLVVTSFTGLGGQLILDSLDWLPQPQDPANSAGTRLVFGVTSVVPVPAAVWLFGSALGLMAFARRRLAA